MTTLSESLRPLRIIGQMILILLAFVFLIMGACAPVPPPQDVPAPAFDEAKIHRHIDEEMGVVCWIYRDQWSRGYAGGLGVGMSCIPLEDLR